MSLPVNGSFEAICSIACPHNGIPESTEAPAPTKKKSSKKDVSRATLTQAANTSTRNLSSIADRANFNVVDSNSKTSQTPPPANSLAARAGLVQKYNEEHGMDDVSDGSRKKYKK